MNALKEYLKELHLPTIRRCYKEEAEHARRDSLSHEEYLQSLIEQEVEERRQNRITRFLRQSKLPLEKTLDTFVRSRLSPVENQKVNALLDGGFIGRNENVLAFGGPGGGKTHLLCAIGIELIHKGYRVRFYSCSLLVQELLIAKRDMKLARFLKSLSKFDAIIGNRKLDFLSILRSVPGSSRNIVLPWNVICAWLKDKFQWLWRNSGEVLRKTLPPFGVIDRFPSVNTKTAVL